MSELSFIKELWYGVDWTEPWLLCLLGFHVCTFLAIILLRRHIYGQASILAILGVLCVATESVNEFAAKNHQKFARQQYFDSEGLFIITVYAVPLLFNCSIIIVCWLYNVWDTMIKVGVMKARRKAKQSDDRDKQKKIK
ncbi:transmembrane protein 18-like [Halichondria panicea]|uniref:transmembrane protein 18-like n=1 Tax=Halichondria panicea TaxID=6063 RepID=UPI00312B32FA